MVDGFRIINSIFFRGKEKNRGNTERSCSKVSTFLYGRRKSEEWSSKNCFYSKQKFLPTLFFHIKFWRNFKDKNQGCFKLGWALIKSIFTYPGCSYFQFLMKNLWHHNYTKMTGLYYYLDRKFEISPTFLIYFGWNMMGVIFIILVLRSLKRNVFIFQTKE